MLYGSLREFHLKVCLGPRVAIPALSVSLLFAIFDFSRRSMTCPAEAQPGDRPGPNPARKAPTGSRAVLRCNRIQLDAEEAGPTSPVFFLPQTPVGLVNFQQTLDLGIDSKVHTDGNERDSPCIAVGATCEPRWREP